MKVSLTEKYLPADCWKWLSRKTSYGSTIIDCCNSAFENPDTNVGLYAQDAECYDLFKEIFYPLITEYHKLNPNSFQSIHDYGNPANIIDMPDELAAEVVSTRVRVGRTIKGYPMAGKLNKEQRLALENKIKETLCSLPDELAGAYTSLCDMSQEERDALEEEHLLFADADDRYLESAGGYNNWPYGRGIYMNKARDFIVWVNEEDHMRIISMGKGASLKQVYTRLVKAIRVIESMLEFEKHDKLGYLTFCPTNCGTGLRASVHIKIPKLEETERIEEMCCSLHLQPRGMYGEHTEPGEGGVYDISNKIRIGHTEWELINLMWNGAKVMLENEKLLNETHQKK